MRNGNDRKIKREYRKISIFRFSDNPYEAKDSLHFSYYDDDVVAIIVKHIFVNSVISAIDIYISRNEFIIPSSGSSSQNMVPLMARDK